MHMILNEPYDREALRNSAAEEQYRVMEAWFRARFEDPAERTPYESSEGGYIWIWGGPYDAEEELNEEFQGLVPDEAIQELVRSLAGECLEWAPTESPDDYDHDLFEAVRENGSTHRTLEEALSAIDNLLESNIPHPIADTHRRLLFANAITALESFLSDTFINRVLANSSLLQLYLDTERAFQDHKVPLKDVLREANRVSDLARQELLNMVWHNIGKVKPMYADVLRIDLGDVGGVARAIQKRHDIVHRNGRQRDGALVVITADDVRALASQIRTLALRVDLALNPVGVEDDNEEPVF